MATFKKNEMMKLFNRAYDNKYQNTEEGNKLRDADENDLKSAFNTVFGDRDVTPNPAMVHDFNNLLVLKAEEVAKPRITNVLNLMARYVPANRGDMVKIDIPKRTNIKFVLSTTGTTVDFRKVNKGGVMYGQPQTFTTGIKYDPNELGTNMMEKFRELINDIADAKLKLFLGEFYKLVNKAVDTLLLPKVNYRIGSNLELTDFNKVSSTIARRGGGKSLFIADQLLIDNFADKLSNPNAENRYKNLLSDDTKDMLLKDLQITQIGRTSAFNITNEFVNEKNNSTFLPVNAGFMVSGSRKVFDVIDYGKMRQYTAIDSLRTNEVAMKIEFEADIVLKEAYKIGYIKDDAVKL